MSLVYKQYTVKRWVYASRAANNLGQQGGNGLRDVAAIAGGRDHGLALTPGGTVLAWGDNSKGAVGDGSTVSVRPSPVAVPGLNDVIAVATGHYHSLALLADGEAWSSSAAALALGTSQRTVQRALDSLAADGRVQSFGRGRARRWLTTPVPGFPTALLLPALLPGD